jgi:hypothetical protein
VKFRGSTERRKFVDQGRIMRVGGLGMEVCVSKVSKKYLEGEIFMEKLTDFIRVCLTCFF